MRAANYVIAQVFSLEEVKEINKLIKENEIDLGKDKAAKFSIKTSKVIATKLGKLKGKLKNFIKFTLLANEKYFGFDLFPVNDDLMVKHNSYEIGSEYSWHIDADTASKTRDLKLTSLINCSETSYEGGDLFVFNRGIEFKAEEFRKPGSVIVLPSFYNHKVTKLTSGNRITVGVYFPGPKFK